MSSNVSPGFGTNYLTGAMGAQSLSIALIGPDQKKRKTMSLALAESGRTDVHEFESYPIRSEEFRWLLEQTFNVIVLDLDSDPDVVLDLVERIRASNSTSVMVYSEQADTRLAVRYMRAGAREFLLMPLEEGIVAEALDRAATTRSEKIVPAKRAAGNLLVFVCPKGGCGATTVACNLAVALAGNSDQKTLLIDLALPIGDAALALGISAQYSTEDAIRNASRLDANLLKELLVKHQSELHVLAAPSNIPGVEGCEDAIDKLITVARHEFDHVVVDVGSRMDLMETTLFRQASTVYLVTLSGISELRNSNRLISQFFPAGGPNLEVVINRFENRLLGGVREDDVAKALGRPVRWKVPEDVEAAREMQYGATGAGNTRISSLSLEMAAAISGASGPKDPKEKKKGLNLKAPTRAVADESYVNDAPQQSIRTSPPAAARHTPVIEWSAPSPITCGDELSSDQLNATASVAGTLVYTPAPGTVLPAGMHKLSVSFTPDDSETYTTTQASVPLEVEKSTPAIAWKKPDAIPCGTPLSASELRAEASVPGRFDYDPPLDEILPAGTHELSVTFTPDDSDSYTAVQATVSLQVDKLTPVIAWPKPDPIPCGTALSTGELCAAASVKGRFDYAPALGEVLPAGKHKLSVSFTPTDSQNYTTAQAIVTIEVKKSTPVIAWPKPDSIICGAPLSAGELCAAASVKGRFDYSPALGEVLGAGTHKLLVTFTPADSENYSTVQATVSLQVEKAAPVIAWTKPDSIPYSTPLGAGQLNATASVAGTLVYTPARGAMLPAGTHQLSVSFTPADGQNYNTVQAAVSLAVDKATPVIAWTKSDSIPSGTPLDATQLNAEASVPGKFDYTPAPGEVLPVGTHNLSLSFTPADSQNYTTVQATVPLEVEKATPVIAWPKPDSIPFGMPLSTSQLCAAASVPGKFDYAPALGEVPPAGTNKLSVTFTPADSVNYTQVRSTVSLDVIKATPSIAWPAPHSIQSDIALGDAQLCASSPVPGTFTYTPGPGQKLPVGTHNLSVTFTPADSANYAAARATVSIKVLEKPGATKAWTSPEPKVPAETHTPSAALNPADNVSYAAPRETVSLNAEKPAAHTEKPAAHIEWPTPQPMKHGKPLRAPELDAAASAPATLSESPVQAKVAAPRVTPFPSDSEKYKPAQAKAENKVEASRETSKVPASTSRENKEISDPVQKFGTSSIRSQASDKTNEAPADIDWLNFPLELHAEESESESKLSQLLNMAKKKWVLAVGGCLILLASGLVAMSLHSRAKAAEKVTIVPAPTVTEYQVNPDDSKPSPQQQAGQGQSVATAAAVHAAPTQTQPAQQQTQTEQADPTPAQSGPTSEQTAMMHDQLNAPSRISQEMQKQDTTNSSAPPPSNFSAAGASGMGGSGNIGNVFGGKAPSVVAALPRGPLVISAGVAMGLLIQKTPPLYPEIAKKARVSGTVQLQATISKAGRIEDLHVVSGPVMLQTAALDAVRAWRYRPYIVDNEPTEVKTTVYVAFSLGQ